MAVTQTFVPLCVLFITLYSLSLKSVKNIESKRFNYFPWSFSWAHFRNNYTHLLACVPPLHVHTHAHTLAHTCSHICPGRSKHINTHTCSTYILINTFEGLQRMWRKDLKILMSAFLVPVLLVFLRGKPTVEQSLFPAHCHSASTWFMVITGGGWQPL